MADTRFTALGMTSSGKTCYVLGMFYEMSVGIRGFRLSTENDMAKELLKWTERLDNTEKGIERFPDGTQLTEMNDYLFKLSHNNEDILSFDWIDYGGGVLTLTDETERVEEVFERIITSMEQSTALYIFLDGDYFCEESYEKKLKNVKRKCSRYISDRIKQFVDTHDNKSLPIVFVVTKIDKCRQYTDNEEVVSIIKEAFSPEFSEGYTVYITSVSLGKNIAENNYKGEVDPINIHLPFFIGVFYLFMKEIIEIKAELKKKVMEIEAYRKQIEASIKKEEESHFLWFKTTNYEAITTMKLEDAKVKKMRDEYISKIDEYDRLFRGVREELVRNEQNFELFIDGVKRECLPEYKV